MGQPLMPPSSHFPCPVPGGNTPGPLIPQAVQSPQGPSLSQAASHLLPAPHRPGWHRTHLDRKPPLSQRW